VADYDELMRHPQVSASTMIVSMSHPSIGTVRAPGLPINNIESNARGHATAPEFGEHAGETLRRFGLSEDEINALSALIDGSRRPSAKQFRNS
jgi:crotonobetainyl-CoA:carnitine CoA-transferase CaiB-like acyl-CoA transferase